MASPVLVGRRGTNPSAASAAVATSAEARAWHLSAGRSEMWLVVCLAIVAVFSRVYTTNSLAGEPTPDEYLYAVHARDLTREWVAGQAVSLEDLGVEGRSVVFESAALSLVLPWDPLTLGRTTQALFNALCVPMTFILARRVGLTLSASLSAALLLMAVPEFQELAWRFLTDSQATFLCLGYLTALVAFIRRPAVWSGLVGLACIALLLLTKESAAVTFMPFVVLAAAIPLGRRLVRSGRRYATVAALVVILATVGMSVLLSRPPGDLARNSLLQRTFFAAPLVLSSLREALPRLPEYSQQLVTLIGPRELGTGFVWATLVGFVWLSAQSLVALATNRPRLSLWGLGWIVAAVVWAPGMVTPWRDLNLARQSDAWVGVAAAAVLVAVGTLALFLRNARVSGWGLALLGLVVAVVLAERMVITLTPKVSSAALTFRSLMPIVPLFAVLAGGGLWAAAGALALLVPTARSARAVVAVLASLILVVFWSPLVRERLSSQPLLGRVADRGADPDTPQGLRVEMLVEAQGWLQANVQPNDVILTGIPRQLAWYADLGVEGMENLIDLGSQPRTEEQRGAYILDRVGPRGISYVIDFNVNWMNPSSDSARQWRQTYEALASRPNLETAYLKRDKFGNPVFYVVRNHGYAAGR